MTMDITKMSAAELKAYAEELSEQAAAKRKEEARIELEARRAKEKAENEKHYAEMFEEIGQSSGLNEEQHAAVYSLAWQNGHSYGYSEVASHYEELAELARVIIEKN